MSASCWHFSAYKISAMHLNKKQLFYARNLAVVFGPWRYRFGEDLFSIPVVVKALHLEHDSKTND